METLRNADWMRIGVGSTLLTGSFLLLSGKRKAGLLVTAAGTALAMLDNKEIVSEWWNALPGYLNNAQRMLDQAQETIDDLAAKRDKVMALFGK
ncbi:MAG TPA: hypothetical protein VG225_06450 [Terracidiphilus sp.]|jgi:hypothetical protein|nr:hypothetical protein [Terracidiphilus sp.]